MDSTEGSYNFFGYIYNNESVCAETITFRSHPPLLSDWDDSGQYKVLLVGVGGEILFEENFSPSPSFIEDEFSHNSEFVSYSYRISIPHDENARSIKVSDTTTGDFLCEYEIVPNKYSVQFLNEPEGLLSEGQILEWSASGAMDGNSLQYALEYSHNDGEPGSWQNIPLNDSSATQYAVDLDVVPGSFTSSAFRVIASDGASHAIDTTENELYVPIRKPQVIKFLSNPSFLRAGVGGDMAVQLRGVDGELTSVDNILWHSDRDGIVGRGDSYDGSNLSVGMHEIKIDIQMGDGQVFEEKITKVQVISVGPVVEVELGDGEMLGLECNELKIDVRFPHAEMDEVLYSMGVNDQYPTNTITGPDQLPIKYTITKTVRLNLIAIDKAGLKDAYDEVLQPLDCE